MGTARPAPSPQAGGSGSPTAPGPRGPRGAAITFTHLSTAKEILKLDWHYPVAHTFKDTAAAKGTKTVVAFVERALPVAEAFYKINGEGNRKPLLVMRECVLCKGTDHALFDRRLGNEKTKLLCQWFYCVKLPPRVLEKNHPFRHLFKKEKPPHLFMCNWDGSGLTEFNGLQTQGMMQKAMVKLIENAHKKKPLVAVKAMMRFLSEFDKHDGMLQTYEEQLQREMLRTSPRRKKIAKIKGKIAKTEKAKAKAMKLAKAVCDLELDVTKVTPADEGPAKKAG